MRKIVIAFVLTFCLPWLMCAQSSSLLGDANGDGTIDIVDALVVAQYYVGLKPANINTAACDVNADGSISIVDALLIAQYYVGVITQFPGGQTQSVEVLKSSAARNTAPTTGDLGELVKGNTTFAVDMYKSVSGSSDNIVFSPYSISVDFGMCYAGAKGATDTEIANTMHFTLGQSRVHNAFNALDLQLAKPGTVMSSSSTGQQFTLRLANSIWGQKNFAFVQSYLDTLAVNYGAGLNILDFAGNPESSRVTINTWVSDQTEQKIKELLPPGSITDLTRLVLTNAIYFKASWYYPFNAANTVPGTFTLLDGSTTTAQMMNQTNPTSSGYEVTGEYQAVSLGYYGSKFSMVLILPEQGKFKTFESSLTADSISSIFSSLATRQVKLTLPKFSFDWSSSLKTLLQSLGMKVPFTLGTADFTGITTASSLFISDAIHKAFIGVNEQGTEAAAATGIILAASIPTPMTMNINRPFIFIIRENSSGTVLFLGRVLKP